MGNRALYLRVGLLLIGGALLLFGFILFLSGGRFAKGQVFESYFRESVQGLVVGAAVKFRGVPVGDVTELALASAEYNDGPPDDSEATAYHQVVVRYRIDVSKLGRHPDIEAAVAAGLRARLATQGLTGLAYVELDFARNAAPPPGVPAALIGPLFALARPGDATMIETPEGFVVASLAEVIVPDPAADPAGVAMVRDQMTRALANDYQLTYAAALRLRGQARVNPKALESVAQP
jgi:hypothetical protein